MSYARATAGNADSAAKAMIAAWRLRGITPTSLEVKSSEAIRRNAHAVELVLADGFGVPVAERDIDAAAVPLVRDAAHQVGLLRDTQQRAGRRHLQRREE